MQSFEQTIIVAQTDLDELNHVNNVRYVQWVNDIAKAHWEKRATKELRAKLFWVLIEHHIHYKSAAILNDKLLIKTYVTKAEGVTSTRIVEMFHEDLKKLIVRSETKWCLMDAATNRPSRIQPEIANLFN